MGKRLENVAGAEAPSPSELIARAEAMIPVLRERSAECERLRRVPDETIADIKQAGFHRIMHPPRFGGYGYTMDVAAEVTMQVGRGCGSTAWMVCQWAAHNFVASMYPLEAQEEYWADGADPLSSTASAQVRAEFEAVKGGMRVSGAWRFSSGIDSADWLILFTPQGNFLVPRRDFGIEDDWFVAGLKGSGSKTVTLNNIFVPDYRVLSVEGLASGDNPGRELYGAPYYWLPFTVWGTTNVSPAVIGTAFGLLDLFEERALKRTDLQTMTPARERPGVQLRFAEASAEVETARMLLLNNHREFIRYGTAREEVPMKVRARFRRDTTYAVKLCVQAGDRLVSSGDASAMYESVQTQRLWRDLHAAALHTSQLWDEQAIQYSRVRWGYDPQTYQI